MNLEPAKVSSQSGEGKERSHKPTYIGYRENESVSPAHGGFYRPRVSQEFTEFL